MASALARADIQSEAAILARRALFRLLVMARMASRLPESNQRVV
jgi:hypothetical protein